MRIKQGWMEHSFPFEPLFRKQHSLTKENFLKPEGINSLDLFICSFILRQTLSVAQAAVQWRIRS